jgi:hypothetical protein
VVVVGRDGHERDTPLAKLGHRLEDVAAGERDVVQAHAAAGHHRLRHAGAPALRHVQHQAHAAIVVGHAAAADQAEGVGQLEAVADLQAQHGAAEQHPAVEPVGGEAESDMVDGRKACIGAAIRRFGWHEEVCVHAPGAMCLGYEMECDSAGRDDGGQRQLAGTDGAVQAHRAQRHGACRRSHGVRAAQGRWRTPSSHPRRSVRGRASRARR